MEKINIAELLKDCPQGMELDSTMYDNLYFDSLDADYNGIIICYTLIAGTKTSISFTKYGTFNNHMGAKCVIFPKGKTTWKGFIPLCKFKAGDVLVSETGNIVLLSHIDNEHIVHYHCIIPTYGSFRIEENTSIGVGRYYECVLANEQQRQRMYDLIEYSGYKYNQQLNKLEKLNEPKFKDGDILYIRTANTWICIYKEGGEKENVYYKYVATSSVTFVHDNSPLCIREHVKEIRLATKDEQQKLFDAIKENGYRWNFQAKRLEELITPIFKKGDKVRVKNGVSEPRIIDGVCDTFYTLVPIGTIDFTEQNRWELVPDKLIKPNFRVGDTIQDVDGYKVEITKVDIDEECYEYLSIIAKGIGSIPFKYQNEWNLVSNKAVGPKFKVGDSIILKDNPHNMPSIKIKSVTKYQYLLEGGGFFYIDSADEKYILEDKFNISALIPFESRVLVRDDKSYKWSPAEWGFYDEDNKNNYPYEVVGGQSFQYCIPYNDDTKHLIGKRDDCDEYYKTWE